MILAINNIILIRPFRYYVVNPPITLLSGLGGQKTAVLENGSKGSHIFKPRNNIRDLKISGDIWGGGGSQRKGGIGGWGGGGGGLYIM